MERLGFGRSATSLYAALLSSNKAMTSRGLAQASGWAQASVLRDLVSLRQSGLVGEDRDHDKTVWFALDPAFSWLSLLAERHWSETVDLAPVTNLAATLADPVDSEAQEMRRARMLSISLWRASSAVGQHRTTTVRNTRQLGQLLVESVSTARQQIRAVSGGTHLLAVHAFWPRIQERMASGVTYRRLTVVGEVHEHGLAVVTRDLEIGVQLKVAPEPALPHRGYLIDSDVLVQYHHDALGQTSGGQVTSDRHSIERFRTKFDRLFAGAEPAADLIDRCATTAKVQIGAASMLSEDSIDLLRQLVDFGKFCRIAQERGWDGDRERAARVGLLVSGLAVVTPHGHLLPNWSAWDPA